MALTDRADVVALYVHGLIETNKTSLGLEDVWLGDQDRSPTTPCVSVEPGPKSREFNGIPRRFQVNFDVFLMVYVEKIQSTELNTEESIALSEEVEAVLHADPTLGGNVIHSYVASSEPGYAERGRTLLRASRLTFRALSQKQLP